MRVGLKKPIVEDDIYECAKDQRSHVNSETFKEIWNKELKEAKPKLTKAIVKFCAFKIFLVGIPVTVLELLCK